MENWPAKIDTISQLYPECISDGRSRFWQMGTQSIPRTEVICPQPRRAVRVSCVADSLNRSGTRPKGILQLHKGEVGLEILDIFLNKDDLESDPASIFCGSPPVRANNPVVHDSKFAKQTQMVAPPLCAKPRLDRVGSPSCGSSSFAGSPKMRVEGFSCGSSDSHCTVSAFA